MNEKKTIFLNLKKYEHETEQISVSVFETRKKKPKNYFKDHSIFGRVE